MKRSVAILFLALSLSGCQNAESDPPAGDVSVELVIENIHNWNGKEADVVGWLGKCGGMDCALYPSLEDARTVEEANRSTERWKLAMDRRLAVGYSEEFDAAAEPLQFSEVRIRARITDECQVACIDRGPDLEPISIEPISSNSE